MPAGLVAGIDEAGRGPVLGPLVVACALTDAPDVLADLGVRDSKELKRAARERLEPQIKTRLRSFSLVVLEPRDIDLGRTRRSLNEIEGDAFARAAAKAAEKAGAGAFSLLQADAADARETNFRAMIVRGLAAHAPQLRVGRFQVEHKADVRFPAVAAASILAKVERDRRILEIAKRAGCEVGSGYPSDPTTIRFLREYITANQDLPPFARRSWKPAQALLLELTKRHKALDTFEDGGKDRGR